MTGTLPAPVHEAPGGFFICDVLDAIPKDDMASMEHPVFSLSTQTDRRVLVYVHGQTRIEIIPSVKGLATIHDKDVLIFCISQLVAALNRGEPVARILHLRIHDLLLATRRETSGDGYRRLREAFDRLAGTRIVTNIVTGGLESTTGFGLIDGWSILRCTGSGRMTRVTVTLSDWLYRVVLSRSVLTLHPGYFSLRKPLERRIYELARKHCGRQAEWRVGLDTLLAKTGSASPRRVFRKMVREIAAADLLPDYHLDLTADDIVHVTSRGRLLARGEGPDPVLPPGIHETARRLAPGFDPRWLEQEWRTMWAERGRTRLRSPEKAFLAFCRFRARRPAPTGDP